MGNNEGCWLRTGRGILEESDCTATLISLSIEWYHTSLAALLNKTLCDLFFQRQFVVHFVHKNFPEFQFSFSRTEFVLGFIWS